jgi:ribosome biogenesis GTPase
MAKGQKYLESDELGTERIRRSNVDRVARSEIKHRERSAKDFKRVEMDLAKARVMGSESAYYILFAEDGSTVRAKTVKSTIAENPNSTLVAVGDEVGIEPGTGGSDAVIRKVYERRTKLSRKAHKRKDVFEQVIAANVDRLLIISSSLEPQFLTSVIDRYIVAGLEGELEVSIVVNKADLMATDPKKEFILEALDYYSALGYPCFLTSGESGEGIDELRRSLEGKVSVLAGRSGVGKSSIINSLLGEEATKIGVLTRKERRGAHTTTSSVMIPLTGVDGAFVIDTPGVREFFNHDLDDENLKFHFAEFAAFADSCEMTNCTHVHEPGCAVFAAAERGEIAHWRYNSYCALYQETLAQRR